MQNHMLQKQIAKEITLLRYIPEHQLYEISITWFDSSSENHSIHYLPEIFLYPFAIKKDKTTQSTKVSEISLCSDTSLEADCPANNTLTLEKDSLYFKKEPSKYETLQSLEQRMGGKARGVLDYDTEAKKGSLRESLLRRNREVLKLKEVSASRKKKRI